MASLDNPHFASSTAVDAPGRPDHIMRVWTVKMRSTSDTLTVPELGVLDAGNADTSSIRVLSPAENVTANPAATTGNNENVVTLAGSAAGAGVEVVLASLHQRGNQGTRAITPA